ncbi:hypothetical protein LINPERHAP1_LOCUS8210 [Linum perenne]
MYQFHSTNSTQPIPRTNSTYQFYLMIPH